MIIGIVQAWGDPAGPDQHDHRIHLVERVLDALDKVLARPDRIEIAKDVLVPEALPQVIEKTIGLEEGVVAPIADEDACHWPAVAPSAALTPGAAYS